MAARMNTFTIEHDNGVFRVRVTGPHGGAGRLYDEAFQTEAEAQSFADSQRMLETGRVGMSPEDRPA